MTQDFAKFLQTMMEQGQTMARAFTPSFGGTSFPGVDPKAFEKLFPAMPKEMLEFFFGKTFNPEGLDARTRFLVTVAALTVQNALAAGATQREIAEVIWQMSMFGGLPATQKAFEIAKALFAETEEKPA